MEQTKQYWLMSLPFYTTKGLCMINFEIITEKFTGAVISTPIWIPKFPAEYAVHYTTSARPIVCVYSKSLCSSRLDTLEARYTGCGMGPRHCTTGGFVTLPALVCYTRVG